MPRPPAVAGQFYPGQKASLEQVLAHMIPVVRHKHMAFGVMSPHAGYVYSGKVAGQSFAGIAIPPETVVIGPNHHGVGHQVAVYHRGSWETPLGEVPIAEELADAILQACPAAGADTLAHRHEHSLEVQIPFLQVLAGELAIVPLCIGRVPLADLLILGDGLAAALRTRPHLPLIVASTDMTHYESGKEADRKDHLALRHVLDLDPEGLYRTVRDNRISMCGVLPTIVMLRAALALGATGAKLVAYANSGDVTGDQREVVGYAGVVIT
jgi:AmmeMemoRadiSam system protein B